MMDFFLCVAAGVVITLVGIYIFERIRYRKIN